MRRKRWRKDTPGQLSFSFMGTERCERCREYFFATPAHKLCVTCMNSLSIKKGTAGQEDRRFPNHEEIP
jgi:hypothetical protein